MEINKALLAVDPSRYTVYQLLDYVKDKVKIGLIQKDMDNLFFIKTKPYFDSLYNYVHVLDDRFTINDLAVIKDFFGGDAFRIKTLADKVSADILLSNGFSLRDSGYAMRTANLAELDLDFSLPVGITIEAVATETSWGQIRTIFSEAFNKTSGEFDEKFGFLKDFILESQEKHLNFFLLYENGVPVTSGGYYAFDKFSIENIGTLKIARGRGYAGAMVRFLLQEARRLGYSEACLVGSEEAVSMYQKVGFEIISKNNTFINF